VRSVRELFELFELFEPDRRNVYGCELFVSSSVSVVGGRGVGFRLDSARRTRIWVG
jgi:hypothetical protein